MWSRLSGFHRNERAQPQLPRKSSPETSRLAGAATTNRLVPLDKSEGVVKRQFSWAVRKHRFVRQ